MDWSTRQQKWVENQTVPPRLLLVGASAWEEAFSLAAQLQGATVAELETKKSLDTLILKKDSTLESIRITAPSPDSWGARELINWITQKPYETWRLLLVEGVERFTPEAQQAFLKILEEPPPAGRFIFTTHNESQLPETWRSRLTIVRIPAEKSAENDEAPSNNWAATLLQSTNAQQRWQALLPLLELESRAEMVDHLDQLQQESQLPLSWKSVLWTYRNRLKSNGHKRLQLQALAMDLPDLEPSSR